MKLKEYLKFNNISNKDFSEKIGISAVPSLDISVETDYQKNLLLIKFTILQIS